MYGEVEEDVVDERPVFVVSPECQFRAGIQEAQPVATQVMNAISIARVSEQELSLEWASSGSNDMIADSALALLSGMDSNFATIKSESGNDRDGSSARS